MWEIAKTKIRVDNVVPNDCDFLTDSERKGAPSTMHTHKSHINIDLRPESPRLEKRLGKQHGIQANGVNRKFNIGRQAYGAERSSSWQPEEPRLGHCRAPTTPRDCALLLPIPGSMHFWSTAAGNPRRDAASNAIRVHIRDLSGASWVTD